MITSRTNSRVKLVHALQTHRKTRSKNGLFVVEGERLIKEALSSRQPLNFLFTSPSASEGARSLARLAKSQGVAVEELSNEIMHHCSATETPSGILAVLSQVELPVPEILDLVLVVDHFGTPGNLGTLLRSAAAAGVQVVLLSEGTVDAYNPKVVRGAMGAHFRIPILTYSSKQIRDRLKDLAVWIAEAGAGTCYSDINWKTPSAIIVGSEAHGPQPDLKAMGKRASIPLAGGVESLNAAIAGSIILFEIQRQRGLT